MTIPSTVPKRSFGPVIDERVQILMLGSLPGEASLAAARYYAHPRNQFWQLMGSVLGIDLSNQDYAGRLQSLLQHRVGLWDVVASAQRQGSLDTALRDIAFNDLRQLVDGLPALQAVAFNGKTAARAARLLTGWPGEIMVLPSSSPAFTLPFAQKLAVWQGIQCFCQLD